METIKNSQLINVLVPLQIIIFIIAVGVVLLYQHFQKNLYLHKLKEETLKREHQREILRANILAHEEERKRIAQDLHDELGSVLSIMRMNMMILERESNNSFPSMLPGLQNIRSLTESALTNMRNISHRLLPPQLEELGLIDTLMAVAEQINKADRLQLEIVVQQAPANIPKDIALGLYRAIMELINNTIKHSGASQATIDIEEQNDQITCQYTDNGRGFKAENAGKGLGHKSIDGRVSALDGTFAFGTRPGGGFYSTISVPLHPS